jgi:predicted  nucleic acid-binding Zn-ribbon protein
MNKYIFPIIILTIIIIIVIVFILFYKNYNIEYDDITNDNDDITNENYDMTNENDNITNENKDMTSENYDMTNENDNMTNENDDDIIENFSSTCVGAKNLGCFAGGDNWWRNPLFCENPLTLGLNWHSVNKDIIDTGEYNEYVNPKLLEYIKTTGRTKIILTQDEFDNLEIHRNDDLTYKSYIKIDKDMYYIPTPENPLLCFIKRLFCMITVEKCDKALLNITINQLTSAKEELDTQVAKLNGNIESLSNNLITSEQSKNSIQTELDNLKSTHETLNTAKTTLEQTLAQVRKNLETKTGEKTTADSRISTLEKTLKTAKDKLSEAQQGIKDLQEEIEVLNDDIDDLTEEKTALTGRIGILEKSARQQESADAAQGEFISSMWSTFMTQSPSNPSPPPTPVKPICILDCSTLEEKILSDYNTEYLGPDKSKNTGYNAKEITISNLGMSSDEKHGFCKIDYKWEKNPDHLPSNPVSGVGRRKYRFKLLNDDACEWNFDTYESGKNYIVYDDYGGELNYIPPPPPPPPPPAPAVAAPPPPPSSGRVPPLPPSYSVPPLPSHGRVSPLPSRGSPTSLMSPGSVPPLPSHGRVPPLPSHGRVSPLPSRGSPTSLMSPGSVPPLPSIPSSRPASTPKPAFGILNGNDDDDKELLKATLQKGDVTFRFND